VQQRKW